MSNVIQMTKPSAFGKLRCSLCGAEADAACGCGAEYVPAAAAAAKAIEANPQKSNRAIAADTGVSNQTVMRARKGRAAPNGAREKREGRDGKSYPSTYASRKAKEAAFDARLDEDLAIKTDPKTGWAVQRTMLDSAKLVVSAYYREMNKKQKEHFVRWLQQELYK